MNPAGFLFGPNATVNVGGMVSFTLSRLSPTCRRSAIQCHPQYNRRCAPQRCASCRIWLLRFESWSDHRSREPTHGHRRNRHLTVGGNITIQSGTLEDGTVQPAKLTAPGGQINLASVGGPGEIAANNFQPASNMTMGNINLVEGTLLDVSANRAGTIQIRGGNFVIADATLMADTGNANASSPAIDINLSGDLAISDTRAMPAITARTTGSGDAGEVRIESGNFDATSNVQTTFALIDTHTLGAGRAGAVNVTTGNLRVTGPDTTAFIFIDSGTSESGNGNDITINARNIDLSWATINTGYSFLSDPFAAPSGSGGNLTIAAESIKISDFLFNTESIAAFSETQVGGNITITGRENIPAKIDLCDGSTSAGGIASGGTITFSNFDTLFMDNTQFATFTVSGPGGGINVTGRAVDLTNGSKLITATFGDGDAGSIRVNATDHLGLIGTTPADTNAQGVITPTGLFTNSWGDIGLGNLGAAGSIEVNTPRLIMDFGGRMNTITKSSGRGGDVIVNADTVSISGEFDVAQYLIEGTIVDIGNFRPSGIFTRTIGGGEICSGVCGNGGNIVMNIGSLTMGPGSQIDSGTSSTGHSGDIAINAANTISLSGTLIDGTPVGVFSRSTGTEPSSGVGGNIALTAGQSVTIHDESQRHGGAHQ